MIQARIYLLTALLTLTAGIAVADVQVEFLGVDPSRTVGISTPFEFFEIDQAGVHNLSIDLGDGPQAVKAFCVDLRQRVPVGVQPYELIALEGAPQDGGSAYSPMGPTKANAIRELWGEHYADVTDDLTAGAFQVAIWEIIYEDAANGYDLFGGDLGTINLFVGCLANEWLDDIDGSGPLETQLLSLSNDTGGDKWQDFVFVAPGGSRPPVPEPLTMATLAAALSGLGVYTRRRVAV